MILGSMLPAIDFDVLEYHLQGPKEYYQAGRISFLPHNVYTNMPFGVEMLHLLAMEVMGDWWWGGLAGQLLVALFGPAAAVLIAAAAARAGSPRAAWFAALVYLSTPWIYRLAVIAYVEGPLCFYHAALSGLAVAGWGTRAISPCSAIWGLLGLLAGGAMGCKYTGLDLGGHPVRAARALRRVAQAIALRSSSAIVLGWAVVMGPWLVKNVSTPATRSIRSPTRVFQRPVLGPSPRDEVVERPRPQPISARELVRVRWSMSRAGPTGSRRCTSRWPRWLSCVRARAG